MMIHWSIQSPSVLFHGKKIINTVQYLESKLDVLAEEKIQRNWIQSPWGHGGDRDRVSDDKEGKIME